MVQKKAFAIVLGNYYVSYKNGLTTLNQERLDERRDALTLNFAIKCTKSPKHCHMFPLNPISRENSRYKRKYKEFQCRTSCYFSGPVPFMARLLKKENYIVVHIIVNLLIMEYECGLHKM